MMFPMNIRRMHNERGALNVGAGIALGVLALVLLVVGGFALRWVTAEPRGALSQREKTIADGNYRIAAYDSFFDQCGAIQAKEDQIRQTEDRRIDDKSGSAGGFTSTQKDAILLALKNSRAELVRSYNADAAKADTKANFLASSLPYQINVNDYNTVCVL